MLQRANVSEEVSLGPSEDNVVHPSLVVPLDDKGRKKEAPLAGSHPPSGHQSACHQGLSSFVVCGYVLENLAQDFRGENRGRIQAR